MSSSTPADDAAHFTANDQATQYNAPGGEITINNVTAARSRAPVRAAAAVVILLTAAVTGYVVVRAVESRHEVPFTVAVSESDDYCRQKWLVPANAGEISKTQPRPDWLAWEKATGGIRADQHIVEFQVQGRSGAAVTLRDVKIVYAGQRNSLITGTTIGVSCGEGAAYRYLRADLDTDPATVTSEVIGSTDYEGKTITPVAFPYRVDRSEPESFLVEANVSRYDVNWLIAVEWSAEGRTGTFTFGIHGKGGTSDTPFRTIGSGAAQDHCVWQETGELSPDSSRGCPA